MLWAAVSSVCPEFDIFHRQQARRPERRLRGDTSVRPVRPRRGIISSDAMTPDHRVRLISSFVLGGPPPPPSGLSPTAWSPLFFSTDLPLIVSSLSNDAHEGRDALFKRGKKKEVGERRSK